MATNRRELPLDIPADKAWAAFRDFGQVHTRVAPGFLTDLRMDGGDRIVTFVNGLVARERLVSLDDEAMRLVYTVVEGRASHYNAAVQLFPRGAHKMSPGMDNRPAARRTGAARRRNDGPRRTPS